MRIWSSPRLNRVFREGRRVDEDDAEHDIEDVRDVENVHHMGLKDLLKELA